VGFSSTDGKGSTFWFTITFDPVVADGVIVSDTTTPPVSLTNLRVLIVDDNATNRRILEQTLHQWGAHCVAVESAPAALTELVAAAERDDAFELALVDYNMPETDGIELSNHIAQDPRIASVKRILLTSSGESGEAGNAIDGGFSSYLTKPVREAALAEHIAKAISNGKTEIDMRKVSHVEQTDMHRPRILMAEDNLVNQNVTRHMLEKMGYDVEVVSHGGEAVEALGNSSFDAVLMDCQMPKVDGYTATRNWRQQEPDGQHVPIIAITAHAMQGDADKCFDAGMDAYLSKPVAWEDLEAMMRRWAPLSSSDDGISPA
jgi:two-component system sensor histidine kinase/response regulator